MTPLRAWIAAVRPKTLGLAVSPVLVGTALGVAEKGSFHPGVFLAALAAAVAIQVGTNLHNDVADHLRGTDGEDRLGPARATSQGWLSPKAVTRGAWVAFLLAFLLGCYLAWMGGWPIMLLGLASLAAGAAYSGGPRPLSHLPLGELFVLLFFGLVAVGGSFYLQTGRFDGRSLLAGLVVGLPAAAVLVVNNYRDRQSDARAGRRTLAVLLPPSGSHLEYLLLMLAPFLLLPLLLSAKQVWLPMLSLPLHLWLVVRFQRAPVGPGLNLLLARTAQAQLLLGLLLSAAFLLQPVL